MVDTTQPIPSTHIDLLESTALAHVATVGPGGE
nr:PPOX class F420-dependent oxidoreductase [Chloroflexia bacterium]